MGIGGLGDGDEEVIHEVLHDRNHDGVAHGVVGFVVGRRELVGLRRSHEERGFAGGDEAGGPAALVVKDEKLAAAATFGGAEAAGEVVEAEFEDLFAVAGAPVAGEDGALIAGKLAEQFAVAGRDDGKEGPGPDFIEHRGVPVDQVAQGLAALPGLRHGPENGVFQGGDGLADRLGMKPVGAVVFEVGGVEVILRGDNENAGPGLGDPVAGVEQHGADLVGALAQRLVEQPEILAAIGGKQADDILQGDDGGFFRHFIEHPEPFPEQAAAGGGEAAHFPGEGEVLAGEAGPDDVAPRDLRAANLLDGAEVEMAVAVVDLVDGGLFRADVVGPDRNAGVFRSLRDQPAAGEEIDEGRCGRFHAII